MLNVYATFDKDGYISQYRIGEGLEGAENFELQDFDNAKFRFYKKEGDELVFDSKKYDAWAFSTDVLPAPQKSLEEVILAKAETQTINIIMEMGLL